MMTTTERKRHEYQHKTKKEEVRNSFDFLCLPSRSLKFDLSFLLSKRTGSPTATTTTTASTSNCQSIISPPHTQMVAYCVSSSSRGSVINKVTITSRSTNTSVAFTH